LFICIFGYRGDSSGERGFILQAERDVLQNVVQKLKDIVADLSICYVVYGSRRDNPILPDSRYLVVRGITSKAAPVKIYRGGKGLENKNGL